MTPALRRGGLAAILFLALCGGTAASPRERRLAAQADIFSVMAGPHLGADARAAPSSAAAPADPAMRGERRRILALYTRLSRVSASDFDESDRTSHDVAMYELDQRRRDLDRTSDARQNRRPGRRYAKLIHKETTTDLTASAIEALGRSEVARIEGELTQLAHESGYADLPALRAALAKDPALRALSTDQIVADFRTYIDMVRPRLGELVRDPPVTRLVVEAMPPGGFPNISHHVDGSADGRTPGRVLVAVSDLPHRSLISDEVIAFHEGLPGHELQVSIQQRLVGVPAFQRELHYGAFSEGWAVYAESLGETLGLYRSPVAKYGRLNTELTRALRLVADTGMHARGWSREQIVEYLRSSGAEDEPTVQAEADRIVAWPAQGLSYKIGQLKILDLRRRAETALGARFDLRDFHAVVLGAGNIPLPVLEGRVDRWIARSLARS